MSDADLTKIADRLLDLEQRLRHIPVIYAVDGADIDLCHEAAGIIRPKTIEMPAIVKPMYRCPRCGDRATEYEGGRLPYCIHLDDLGAGVRVPMLLEQS